MVAVIAISFVLIGVSIVIAIGRRFFFVRPEERPPRLVTVRTISLFEPDEKILAAIERAEHHRKSNEEREKLLAWASLIKFEALPEAQIEIVDDQKSWDYALEILTDRAAQDEDVCALVSFVVHNQEFNVNQRLVNKFQAVWENAPDFQKTARCFELAIRTDNARLFQSIFSKAEQLIKTDKLSDLSSGDLCELATSHFWLLSPSARMSGTGFWLKQKLNK